MAFTDTVVEIASTNYSGQGRSTFLNRLKEEFIPAWEDHVHTKVVIASMIAQKRGTMGGRRSLTSVMASYPQSTGVALFEADTLPLPTTGTYFNPSIMARTIYSRLRWTGHVERSAKKGDKVAWAQPRAEDLRTSRQQWELNFARMLYLGPKQILATVSSNNTGTAPDTVTLYNRDSRDSTANNRHRYGAHYLRINMDLMHIAASGGNVVPRGNPVAGDNYSAAVANPRRVSAIDTSGTDPTIQITRADGTADFATVPAANDILIPFRSRLDSVDSSSDADSDSGYAGPNGLMNLAVDSNIESFVYGISRTSFPTLNAFMINNGSGGVRPFKEDYITLAVDRIMDDGTGDDPDVIVCHKSVRREFVKEIAGNRRFPEVITKKGFGALKQTIGDVNLPLVTDRDCMPGVMWVLESEGFGWFSESDMQMADEGERFVDSKDAHEIVMVKSGNLATRKPHNNAMIDDITYSVSGLTDLP